ncbi:zinc-dependent alcohol dehydrogenase [Streptomyces ipomoeae]|jgi:propanol-preferring alcohol dehydrogenase|uniref:Alcohol dehydrogenase n=1 Tax=Streptomyces ipomoeae 91-03 TaxID=698759 RepID=L1L3U7_9ACTN|nr:zinc-dependent alcohol dehydrogenase [Streptomyces ipomoeae]EKX67469.1 oxidoreductase, zinc-binding dehydrogenase family protein [Streptomyces ipomoeae 91-03]MDX2699161.1 zinc-dependent alcohol dehydrogenase [Streptomyces ipomoeae]MDX2826554.1 zinc-dependent alcohol dehydrogenase [Streptomyces ipomoeae]MDX2844837.1 zinc-dependent alcohol dehydrogenase [Streptomyces ipomoeae]MDX2879224.1 zinc-dependent alcohol dehydrogenase [Streptomyces ipomoeae]
MKAAVVRAFGEPLVIEERPDPDPGPGQVRIRVEASGLCHTDIHAAHGDWPVKPNPPFVPGHEGVGLVDALGDGVTHLSVGQRVAVPWPGKACGRCEHCLSGWETLCERQINTGYGCDGGYAEKMPARADFAQPVPEGIIALEAAPLTCAGVTTYKALKVADVKPTQLVAISGIGGLGHLAVQYAKIAGATVAAVDVTDDKLELAAELGADLVIDARKHDVGEVLKRHGGAHAAIALAVNEAAFAAVNSGLRRGGKLVMVALPAHGTVQVPIFDTVLNGTSVIGSIVGTRQDLAEVFQLHAVGRTKVIYETRPPASVNESIDAVLRGEIKARIVFDLAKER